MAYTGRASAIPTTLDDAARLPLEVSYGARGSHFEFLTDLVETRSGRIDTNLVRSQGLGFWRIRKEVTDVAERNAVFNLLGSRFGRHVRFRMRDWADFELRDETLVLNASGDAVGQTEIQVTRSYSLAGGGRYVRKITKLVDPAVWTDERFMDGGAAAFEVEKNGSVLSGGYSVNWDTGVVTLGTALASGDTLKIKSGLFHVPVMLANDDTEWEIQSAAGDGALWQVWNIDVREVVV